MHIPDKIGIIKHKGADVMDKLRLGVIGLGQRGDQLMKEVFVSHDAIVVTALCDTYEDRVEAAAKLVTDAGYTEPFKTANYKEVLNKDLVDCVVIAASWNKHIDMSVDCLEAGIPCGCEIGGCETIDECFKIVEAYERTKTPFMFMENCCYGRYELMVLNMVKQGVFGEIVHCSGGYHHDLRHEITHGKELRHYRLNEYLTRNCENYPTHELGPIAQVLDINRGNRFVSLTILCFTHLNDGIFDLRCGKILRKVFSQFLCRNFYPFLLVGFFL